jgi:hypothetical protein
MSSSSILLLSLPLKNIRSGKYPPFQKPEKGLAYTVSAVPFPKEKTTLQF